MSSTKKLQKAAIKFRKENSELYHKCAMLLSQMSNSIIKTGVAEIIAYFTKSGEPKTIINSADENSVDTKMISAKSQKYNQRNHANNWR